MFNLNIKICVQKLKLACQDKQFTNFFVASMPSIFRRIIDNLNMRNILMLEETVCILCIKEIKLTNLGIIKKESTHFLFYL